MTGKRYSVEEANALLPHIAPALVELREKFEEALQIRATVARIGQGNGWSSERDEWAGTLQRVAELLERFQEWEVEIKDVTMGLVDFPAVMAGEDVYLCWRLGEPEVAYWHTIEGGFAGRRPI
jgi:hypothetical protein